MEAIAAVKQCVAAVAESGLPLAKGECQIFCVTEIWSMLPDRKKDDDDFVGTVR